MHWFVWLLTSIGWQRRVAESKCLVLESLGEVVGEQMRERQVEVDAFDSVFSYPNALEERLVVGAAELVGRVLICFEAVGDECECLVEVAFDLVESQGA